jgi:hypothetical protein
MDALISARAGTALLIQGSDLASIHIGSPDRTKLICFLARLRISRSLRMWTVIRSFVGLRLKQIQRRRSSFA